MNMCWFKCRKCGHTHRGFEGNYTCPACPCHPRFGDNPTASVKRGESE